MSQADAMAELAQLDEELATLPMTFQPTINTDFSQVKIETVPGSTLAQTTAVTRKVADMLSADTDVVEAAFADIEPTSADIFLTLKKDRPISSVEWERKVAPKFQSVADARVNFQSQSGGGFGRDIIMMFGSDDPELLDDTANQLVMRARRLSLRARARQGARGDAYRRAQPGRRGRRSRRLRDRAADEIAVAVRSGRSSQCRRGFRARSARFAPGRRQRSDTDATRP